MNTTVKDRLFAFIAYKGIKKNKFETMCGLSHRYVSNISRSIQPDIIEKISLTFPELNMGWVLTGQGEMLNNAPAPQPESEPAMNEPWYAQVILNQSLTIKRLTEENAELKRLAAATPKKEVVGL